MIDNDWKPVAHSPRPITLTYIPDADYKGVDPEPFVAIGEAPAPDPRNFTDYLKSLPGYGTPFAVLTITEDGTGFEWAGV